MKLGKYIKHLLPEHEIVIVPGFGALKTIDKPAEIDESGENIVPPSKEVAFYPEIKNNDGLLVSHVAQQENVSHFEALQLIEKERGEILYKIDKGEKVVLEGVGIFFLNESEKIVVEPVSGAAVSPDFFGLEPASLEKPGPIEKKPVGKQPEKDERIAPEGVAKPATGSGSAETEPEFEPVEKIDWELQEEEKEKKKRRGWIWLLLLLIPIAGAGIYLWMNENNQPADPTPVTIEETNPTEINTEPELVVTDSLEQDSLNDANTETSENTITDTTGEPRFYLVAGSFKEEQNVEKYITELKNKGYEPFKLGKKGNFYLVGISIYNTEKKALVAQDSFLAENPGSGAWVYEE